MQTINATFRRVGGSVSDPELLCAVVDRAGIPVIVLRFDLKMQFQFTIPVSELLESGPARIKELPYDGPTRKIFTMKEGRPRKVRIVEVADETHFIEIGYLQEYNLRLMVEGVYRRKPKLRLRLKGKP